MSISSIYDVKDVLNATCQVLKEHPWEPVGRFLTLDDGETPSTARRVFKLLKSPSFVVEGEFDERVEFCIVFYKGKSKENIVDPFWASIDNILNVGQVTQGNISKIVLLMNSYDEEMLRVQKLKPIAANFVGSGYIGEVKKRDEFFLMYMGISGGRIKPKAHILSDSDGNKGYFFYTGDFPIGKYECFVMRATPVDQRPGPNGTKWTQFNRIKIKENLGRAPGVTVD